MGIEASVQQTVVAVCNMGWGVMSDVDNLDSIRDLKPISIGKSKIDLGKGVAETLSAAKPHDDAFSGFYELFDLHENSRSAAMRLQRTITAEMAKKDLNFGTELDLAECYKNLTAALQKNETLLKDYKALCATLQACRTDEVAQGLGQGGSMVSKILTSQTAPFIKAALGTAVVGGVGAAALATAGVAVGVALLAGGIAYKVSADAETAEKDQRLSIKRTTEEVGQASNKAAGVLLNVMGQDKELAKHGEFIQKAKQAAEKHTNPLVGIDMVEHAREIKEITKGEDKSYANVNHIKNSLTSASKVHDRSNIKLWRTLDDKPEAKTFSLWGKVKNVFTPNNTLEKEVDHYLKFQQDRIHLKRDKLDSALDASAALVQVKKELLGAQKGESPALDDKVTFRTSSGLNSSAALLKRLEVPLNRVFVHVPDPEIKPNLEKTAPVPKVEQRYAPGLSESINHDDFRTVPSFG